MPTQTLTKDSLNTKLLLKVLIAYKKGDFSVRLPGEWTGEAGKIADTLNDIIELSDKTAKEVERVSRVVGKEGKIMHRAAVPAASGSWLRLVDSTNLLIDDMARPTSEMARVIGAVANGDLSERMGRHSGPEEHHQYDGGPAELIRLGSYARGARSRYGRKVGWPGGCARRCGHLEGSDRQREFHGQQPYRSGAQHRGCNDGCGE